MLFGVAVKIDSICSVVIAKVLFIKKGVMLLKVLKVSNDIKYVNIATKV